MRARSDGGATRAAASSFPPCRARLTAAAHPGNRREPMKKLLNDPSLYVEQMLEGLVLAHPQYYERTGDDGRIIKRPGAAKPGKVGIVSGGGSGHLPIFTGYVGTGLLDACATGEGFS